MGGLADLGVPLVEPHLSKESGSYSLSAISTFFAAIIFVLWLQKPHGQDLCGCITLRGRHRGQHRLPRISGVGLLIGNTRICE